MSRAQLRTNRASGIGSFAMPPPLLTKDIWPAGSTAPPASCPARTLGGGLTHLRSRTSTKVPQAGQISTARGPAHALGTVGLPATPTRLNHGLTNLTHGSLARVLP